MNVRRAAGAVLLALTFAAAPAVANAYEADDYVLTVSTTTPVVGETFTASVTGPAGNPSITLTISSPDVADNAITVAGTKALAKDTADGDVTFSATLAEPATYSLVATDASGAEVGSAQVVAIAGDTSGAASDAGTSSGAMPSTGADQVLLVVGAAVLVTAGLVVLLVSRSRRQRSHG
ncbi:peptidase [Cellulosimicrobium terreum]|nr:peptidase [Cellulosimicrobium terreum]